MRTRTKPNIRNRISPLYISSLINKAVNDAEIQNLSRIDELTPFNEKVRFYYETKWIGWGLNRPGQEANFLNQYPIQISDAIARSTVLSRAITVLSDLAMSGFLDNGSKFVVEGGDMKTELHLKHLTDEVVQGLVNDAFAYNGCYLDVIQDQTSFGTGVLRVKHMPFADLRVSSKYKSENPFGYFYSPYWNALDWMGNPTAGFGHEEVSRPKHIPQLNIGCKRGIIENCKKKVGDRWYPSSDIEPVIANTLFENGFWASKLSDLENGMQESVIMQIAVPKGYFSANAEKREQEKEAMIRDAQEQWKGSRNTGNPLIQILETDGSNDVQIKTSAIARTQNDTKYMNLHDMNIQDMLTAMSIVSGECIGISKPSGFTSTADTLKTAYALMKFTSILPKQRIVIGCIEKYLRFYGCKFTKISMPIVLPLEETIATPIQPIQPIQPTI